MNILIYTQKLDDVRFRPSSRAFRGPGVAQVWGYSGLDMAAHVCAALVENYGVRNLGFRMERLSLISWRNPAGRISATALSRLGINQESEVLVLKPDYAG